MSDEADDLPRYAFQIGRKTVAALQARGGNLYITRDGAGLPRARTTPPDAAIPMTTISGEGWLVHVDSAIAPAYWAVKWTRLPWPHFALRTPTDDLPTGSWVGAVLGDLPLP